MKHILLQNGVALSVRWLVIRLAFIWVFLLLFFFFCVLFFPSPDGTHEWWLLIIHAIERYLCLLSPVSARKRKRESIRVWQRGREWRTGDKHRCCCCCCCGHMHVHLYEWTRTPSRHLDTHTRVSNKATGLTCSYLLQPFFFFLLLLPWR